MRPRLFALRLALVLSAAPLAFAGQDPGAPSKVAAPTDGETEEEAEPELALRVAEGLYRAALDRFKSGDAEAGRAGLRRAFGVLVDQLEEEALPAALQAEFVTMLDKIRNWDPPEVSTAAAPGELDVSDEALAAGFEASRGPPRAIEVDRDNPVTRRYIDIYAKQRPGKVEEALARSGRYREMILSKIAARGLPRELLYLVMTESEFKPQAVSRAGAAGLWQFMPYTARRYGLEVSYWLDERYDPAKATDAALRYLADLSRWFGDWHLALAAYNRGEGGIGRDLRASRSADFAALSNRNALPRETRHYVPKFMACVLIGEKPESYGLKVEYEEPDVYDEVPLERDLDLGIAAKAARSTEEELRRLNPSLRAWCTPKGRPFLLRIPKGRKEAFLAALADVQDWNPGPSVVRYKVRRGDYLGRIAKRHNTTVRAILAINKLKSPRLLRVGMTLVIRPGRPKR